MEAIISKVSGKKRSDSGSTTPRLCLKATPRKMAVIATHDLAINQCPRDGFSNRDGRKYGSVSTITIVVPIKKPSIDIVRTARPYSSARKNNTNKVSGPIPPNVMNLSFVSFISSCV